MDYELLAAQLRKPSGAFGREVGEQMNVFNQEINLKTIDFLNIQEGNKVLEVGMGNGILCKHILQTNKAVSYTGCDYSELMVRESYSRNEPFVEINKADFMIADAAHLPFPDNYFNRVFTVNTLYFFKKPLREISEIKRVLAPDGLAVISIRTKESMQDMPVAKFGFRLYDEVELLTLLNEAGFKKMEVITLQDEEEVENSRLTSLYGLCRK